MIQQGCFSLWFRAMIEDRFLSIVITNVLEKENIKK